MGLLIKRAFTPHELPLLVEVVFSSKGERDVIRCLGEDDAQTFIDVIDEARFTLPCHRDTPLTDLDIHTFR